ncbi:unnamed protein product [Macrosiphum euphorbiae]|uniref:Uncharacterized protein n=1 Tax=Macrosiphum euphorbiae TaxID=13131 RepID=A0AAV0VKP2_9HEMI|nr:unnamed protein product [Macrosiphum euphorbiae]
MLESEIPERRSQITISLKVSTELNLAMFYNQLEKLQRIIAYCLRFKYNCRAKNESIYGPITAGDEYTSKTGSEAVFSGRNEPVSSGSTYPNQQ